jgi:hypothetical protein
MRNLLIYFCFSMQPILLLIGGFIEHRTELYLVFGTLLYLAVSFITYAYDGELVLVQVGYLAYLGLGFILLSYVKSLSHSGFHHVHY